MTIADFLISALVLSGAIFLLYRSVWKKQGFCHGCGGGACRPRGREPAGLLRLGAPPRPPARGSGPWRVGG